MARLRRRLLRALWLRLGVEVEQVHVEFLEPSLEGCQLALLGSLRRLCELRIESRCIHLHGRADAWSECRVSGAVDALDVLRRRLA